MELLTRTNTSLMNTAILLLRGMVGLIFFVAGAGKLMGWFGGFGMKTTLEMFKAGMNISAPLAYLSCYTEFIGGFLVIIGFLTRPAGFALVFNMLVAVVLTGPKNFFMGGAAYPCSLGVSCLVILLAGPMAYSLDAVFAGRNRTRLVNS